MESSLSLSLYFLNSLMIEWYKIRSFLFLFSSSPSITTTKKLSPFSPVLLLSLKKKKSGDDSLCCVIDIYIIYILFSIFVSSFWFLKVLFARHSSYICAPSKCPWKLSRFLWVSQFRTQFSSVLIERDFNRFILLFHKTQKKIIFFQKRNLCGIMQKTIFLQKWNIFPASKKLGNNFV